MGISLIRTPVPELSQSDVFFPFERLAITLSGGGFRASAYSLGCLSYLNILQYEGKSLLERVKFIAGASGGSMTGLLFSAHNHMGIPFEVTYKLLREEILEGDRIIKQAAQLISDDAVWKDYPTKNRNTINAFALAYQKSAFDNLSFDVYWNNAKATIEEVCFNASELENGRAFRFQTDGKTETDEILGNNYLRIVDNNSAAARKLRLGDILAASSCFPAGFEPMVFPDDFAIDEAHQKQLMAETETAINYDWQEYMPMDRPFALMDGGITDNQGIESLKLTNDRSKKATGRGYDLILICDVANYFMESFEPLRETNNWWNNISIRFVINLHKYSILIFVASLVLIITNHFADIASIVATISGIMFGLYLFARFALLKELLATGRESGEKNEWRSSPWHLPITNFLEFFLNGPVGRTALMLKSRVRSSLRVAMEIYLLQIRRINYDSLYTDAEWAYKTKAVSIYELSKSNERVLQRQFARKNLGAELIKLLTPTETMMEVAELARKMTTTLWFSTSERKKEKNERDALIATGQFTMCYNLIEYISQIEDKYPQIRTDGPIQQLKAQLLKDWDLFKQSPMRLVEEGGRTGKIVAILSVVNLQNIPFISVYSYFYFMAKKRRTKKSVEELGNENEFMKLKMMAEFGGNFVGSGDIPAEVENKFLKQIINFHKQHENSSLTTVYEYIGEPEYNHVNDLGPKEVGRELKRLMKLMSKNQVSLSVLAETPERDVYKFVTEELFKHQIENVRLKGWVNQFIYEEFHPNAEYDVKNIVSDCLQSVFVKDSPFFEDRFSEELKNSIGLSLDTEELHAKITSFWSGFKSVRLEDFAFATLEINPEERQAHTVCDVVYKVQKDKGQRFKKERTRVEIHLTGSKLVDNWWEISQIACPVID